MSEPATKTALTTLDSLEARLRKIQWYLSGNDEAEDTLQKVTAQGHDYTVHARLARLEHDLGRLSSRSPVVRDLLRLSAWCPCLERSSELMCRTQALRIPTSSTPQPPTSPRRYLRRKSQRLSIRARRPTRRRRRVSAPSKTCRSRRSRLRLR